MLEIESSWEGIEQPNDHATAGSSLLFYAQTYRTFQTGLNALVTELKKYSDIGAELHLEASPYEEEIDILQQMIDYGENLLGNRGGHGSSIFLQGVSYGSLRYLKAGVLFLAQKRIEKRAEINNQYQRFPIKIIRAVDEKIQQLLNLAEMGKLNGLRPAEVFFDTISTQDQKHAPEEQHIDIPAKMPEYSYSEVTVIDSTLRERCLGLLRALDDQNIQQQFDIIVREMSVILEDRVRSLAELGTGKKKLEGVALMSAAFTGEPVRIKFSDDPALQDSAHLLFRGYSGFVRNEVMHNLVKSYTRERVIQLLGFVDYLLFLLSMAEIPSKASY